MTATPTFVEPRDTRDRADMLNRLDASLMGADMMAGSLGQITVDYGAMVAQLRTLARTERQKLLKELEGAA